MKNNLMQICVLLVALVAATPSASLAQDPHKDWIELSSASWSSLQHGAAARLADGKYRTEQGQFLIVANGKVTAKGTDYRSYRPTAAARAPATTPPPREVASGTEPQEAALLLPAVQKVRTASTSSSAAQPRDVQAAPQKGIEPDEIDARTRARSESGTSQPREVNENSPRRTVASSSERQLSVQQMMVKLRPKPVGLVGVGSGGGTQGPTNVQAKPAEPPKYEIADCGTATSPMICCHHEQGDGSSCNLFKILCENAGGTAQGDGESAACSDW